MSNKPFGPTYEEMLYPDKAPSEIRQKAIEALKENEMDPINLFNITWKDANNEVRMIGGACDNYSVVPGKLEIRAKVAADIGITVEAC